MKKIVLITLAASLAFAGCSSTKSSGAASYSPKAPSYSKTSSGPSVLFKTFGGCGIQIWQNEWGNHENTFDIDYVSGTITVGSVGWWGGSFGCYDNGIPNGAHFDLSHIAKMTFEAKASSYGTIYLNFDGNFKTEVDLTPNFKEYEVEFTHLKGKTDFLFMVGGVRDLNDAGTTVTLQKIAFYDDEGNEVVPKYR